MFGLRLICTENDRETRKKKREKWRGGVGGGEGGVITEGPRIY